MAKKKNKGLLAVLGIGAVGVFLLTKKDPVTNVTTPAPGSTGSTGNTGNSNLTSPADTVAEIKPLGLPVLDFAVKNSFNWEGLPEFQMPAGTIWPYCSYMFTAADVPALLAHGFTHIDVDRAHNVNAHGQLTKAQRYSLVTSNAIKSIAPNFGENGDAVTTVQKAKDAVGSWLGGRSVWFGNDMQWCDIFEVDLESGGNDAQFFTLANAAIDHAKTVHGVRLVSWYASGPVGSTLYGGDTRWNNFKDRADIFTIIPYVADANGAYGGNAATARDETSFWLWQQLNWSEASYPKMDAKRALSWFSGGWNGDPGNDSINQFIRPDMAEGTPIWHAVSGGMRNGGGLSLWGFNTAQSYTGMEKKFMEGMYRVSRLNDFWAGAGHEYNQKLEYSEDNGTTWKTDPVRTWQTAETDASPYVRYVQKGNEIVIAAYYPKLKTGQKEILIRKGSWKTGITVKARETFLGRATLPA